MEQTGNSRVNLTKAHLELKVSPVSNGRDWTTGQLQCKSKGNKQFLRRLLCDHINQNGM